MKTIVCLACLFLGVMMLNGQQPTEEELNTKGRLNDHTTYEWGNGKAWGLLDAQAKVMEVTGIENGMMLLLRESYTKLSRADRVVLDAKTDALIISGFRMSDTVGQIDGFYADSSNLRIPMADAYVYAMKKMHGANPRELEDDLATLRATYNQ